MFDKKEMEEQEHGKEMTTLTALAGKRQVLQELTYMLG